MDRLRAVKPTGGNIIELFLDKKASARIPVVMSLMPVNADDHVLYRRFHRPEDEKRMPVLLHPYDFDAWLNCTVEQAATFMRQFPAELLEAEPAPLPARAGAAKKLPRAQPKTPPEQPGPETGGLFD